MIAALEVQIANSLTHLPESEIKEAMLYALLGKGKRLRPRMLIAAWQDIGKAHDIADDVLQIATAIEMIHTYSLVHDDLPVMDNDDLRRGRATCHKQFSQATALLCGDALLSEAFHIVCRTAIDADKKVAVIAAMCAASGAGGMILGQHFDLQPDDEEKRDLQVIDHLKTGQLFALPLIIACILQEQPALRSSLQSLGEQLGLAFQMQDDMLDVISTAKELGKPTLSDLANDKKTYIQLLGIQGVEEEAKRLYMHILEQLRALSMHEGCLAALVQAMMIRTY